MKKLLSTLFLFFVFLIMGFSVSSLYFSSEAEQLLRVYLKNSSEVESEKILRYELLNYRKTLLGAEIDIQISSDIDYLDEKIGEIKLTAKLLNGPLFITKKGLSFGRYRWYVSIDESVLDKNKMANIRAIFPEKLPYLIVRTDFKRKLHYRTNLKTSISRLSVMGAYDLKEESNFVKILFDGLEYQFPAGFILGGVDKAKADEILFHIQQKKTVNHFVKDIHATLEIPSLELKLKNTNKLVTFNFRSFIDISSNSENINGFFKVKTSKFKNNVYPIDKAEISLSFEGVSTEGFLHLSEKKAELDNLKLQAKWSLQEAGEYPEGQDHIWQLYEQIDEAEKQLKPILLKETFKKNSQIKFKLVSDNSSGKSELNGTLKRIDTQREKSIQNRQGGLDQLIWSIFTAKANVSLDDELFSYLKKSTPINKSKFKLTLEDKKLLMH